MPLYDFECQNCGERFEALVAISDLPACPVCASTDLERLYGPIAAPFTTGLRGGDARRSNAKRRVREELRQEGFRKQREQLGLPPRKAD
jgi:putative FmdB family regulatory protein